MVRETFWPGDKFLTYLKMVVTALWSENSTDTASEFIFSQIFDIAMLEVNDMGMAIFE